MALTINDDGAGGDGGHGESVRAKYVNIWDFLVYIVETPSAPMKEEEESTGNGV